MTRRTFFSFAGLMGAAVAHAETLPADPLPDLWAKFSEPMNDYIEGLNHQTAPADKLTLGVRAWRRMSKVMGWDQIR